MQQRNWCHVATHFFLGQRRRPSALTLSNSNRVKITKQVHGHTESSWAYRKFMGIQKVHRYTYLKRSIQAIEQSINFVSRFIVQMLAIIGIVVLIVGNPHHKFSLCSDYVMPQLSKKSIRIFFRLSG